jgi:hypothetical protein
MTTPEKRIEEFIGILEEAYICGHNVRLQDAFTGNTVIIESSAIPQIRELMISKELGK